MRRAILIYDWVLDDGENEGVLDFVFPLLITVQLSFSIVGPLDQFAQLYFSAAVCFTTRPLGEVILADSPSVRSLSRLMVLALLAKWYLLPFAVVSQIGKDFGEHIQMYVFYCYD